MESKNEEVLFAHERTDWDEEEEGPPPINQYYNSDGKLVTEYCITGECRKI